MRGQSSFGLTAPAGCRSREESRGRVERPRAGLNSSHGGVRLKLALLCFSSRRHLAFPAGVHLRSSSRYRLFCRRGGGRFRVCHTVRRRATWLRRRLSASSVTNQNFLDMAQDAVSDGLATRLGTVNGNNSRIFTLNPSLAVRDLRIVATPIGGNGQASTGEVIVSPGQTIEFRIGSTLRNSSVSIRSP